MLDDLSALLRSLGGALMEWRAGRNIPGEWQGTQFKSAADRWAHDILRTRLAALTPDIPVISEEDAGHDQRSRPRRYWLIDPIDGTASYAGGFDGFVTQAALMEDDAPTLAAVHAPAAGLMYLARRGQGAARDGRKLRIRPDSRARRLIDNWPRPRGSAADAYAALAFDGYVESGSIGLKICRIADGTADLFFKDVAVRDWDVAAPALVLAEAGGRFAALDGAPFRYVGSYEKPGMIAAAGPALLEEFLVWCRREAG